MEVHERDLELLDAWLDGALAAGDASALQLRLQREPALSAALVGLRAERAQRLGAFTSLEPDAISLAAFNQRLLLAARTAPAPTHRKWLARAGAAVAASILVGVLTGWFARGVPNNAVAPGKSNLASGNSTSGGDHHTFDVALTDEQGNVVAVQKFESLDRARAFTDDLNHWQRQQADMQNGNITLVGDRF